MKEKLMMGLKRDAANINGSSDKPKKVTAAAEK